MLAQAQECFLQKAISEQKSAQIISKIAGQAIDCFASCKTSSKSIDKSLINVIDTKILLYNSVANYYRSFGEKNIGVVICRLSYSMNQIKEAMKLNERGFLSKLSKEGNPMLDILKHYMTLIGEKLSQSERDNEIIYHETVPLFESLSPVDKLMMAKPLTLKEIFSDYQKIIGQDLFDRAVPIEVHEFNSIFSEEKAKFQRKLKERVDVMNLETMKRLDNLSIESVLSQIDDLNFPGPKIISAFEKKKLEESRQSSIESFRNLQSQPPVILEQIQSLFYKLDLDLKENDEKTVYTS